MLKFKATSSLFIKMMKDCFHKHTRSRSQTEEKKFILYTPASGRTLCWANFFSPCDPADMWQTKLEKVHSTEQALFSVSTANGATSLECGRFKFFDGLCMKSILWIPYYE